MFIGDQWIVTVHHGAGDLIARVAERWDKARRFAGTRLGVAVYSLLDVVVDGYFETIDRFEEFYDDAADQVFGEQPIEPQFGSPGKREAAASPSANGAMNAARSSAPRGTAGGCGCCGWRSR